MERVILMPIRTPYQHFSGATKSRGFVGDMGYVGTVSLWVSYVGLWVSC